MEHLADLTDCHDGSLPEIDILVGGVIGQYMYQVDPLVSGDLDHCYVRDHVGAGADDYGVGVS